MTWSIRHEGSPRSIDGLALTQVVEGMQDGLWEPTDEVKGPRDPAWVAIESHPQLADIAQDLEPLPGPHHEDETRLDMNPLIDVCLVLLIFFILTTTYAALQKVLPMPGATKRDLPKGPPVITKEAAEKLTILVQARTVGDKPVIKVEDEVVAPENLVAALQKWRRDTQKTEILLDASGVDYGTVVAIQDAAAGAGVSKVHVLVQPGAAQP